MAEPPRVTASSVIGRGKPLAADLGGELVLMSLETGRYYGLDETGSAIWKRLDAPVQVGSLCADLSAEFDAPPGRIEQDVLAFLCRLAGEGLVEVEG